MICNKGMKMRYVASLIEKSFSKLFLKYKLAKYSTVDVRSDVYTK